MVATPSPPHPRCPRRRSRHRGRTRSAAVRGSVEVHLRHVPVQGHGSRRVPVHVRRPRSSNKLLGDVWHNPKLQQSQQTCGEIRRYGKGTNGLCGSKGNYGGEVNYGKGTKGTMVRGTTAEGPAILAPFGERAMRASGGVKIQPFKRAFGGGQNSTLK